MNDNDELQHPIIAPLGPKFLKTENSVADDCSANTCGDDDLHHDIEDDFDEGGEPDIVFKSFQRLRFTI